MLRIVGFVRNVRPYSIKHATKEPVKYTTTINLPKTKFPARLPAGKREQLEKKLVETTFAQTYQYQWQHNKEPQFILHDGPPYANGDLHMGHAVNKILKDITLRYHLSEGRKINYIPGWDCHGLPIELKALASTGKTVGLNDPTKVREKSRQFAWDAIERQKSEFRSWGIVADWQRKNGSYYTFNPDFICNQLQMFLNFYEKGLVYRDLKPVYWSPSSRTALAEAELEYDNNFVSPSIYVRFGLETVPASMQNFPNQKIYALIWTTTPWTLPSNQAICFNSSLEYSLVQLKSDMDNDALYLLASNLIDDFVNSSKIDCEIKQTIPGTELSSCTYKHPLYAKQPHLPFFDAMHVQDSKGTGLVHTAPAHGPDDFLICLSNNIAVKSLVNEEGVYNSDAPSYLQGKSVLKEGNTIVMQHLKDNLIYADIYKHSYPLDWRTKEPVIIRASEQWFINTTLLKEKAAKEIEKIEIYPRVNAEASKNALRTQVAKRPYWCISRQRAWGVPIPVFYNKSNKQIICNPSLLQHICELVMKEGSIDFWWSKPVNELLPKSLMDNLNLNVDDVVKGMDIFDIWFDSGSTWSQVLNEKHIADLYLEGYDQFTGWFQSSLLTSVAARDCSPYKSLFVHGFTVDEKGHKMSKSLGNVISPKDITKKYGVDVLRWWVASHGTQHMAITVSDKLLQQSAESLSKIRSTLRYLNGVIGEKIGEEIEVNQSDQGSSLLNQYLLSKLFSFEEETSALYNSFEYNRVTANIQNFVTNQISALYVHLIKDRLYCGTPEDIKDVRHTLKSCYKVFNKVLWPLAPFLVEESWSYYDPSCSFHQAHVKTRSNWKSSKAEEIVEAALNVRRLFNQKANNARNSWLHDVTITCGNNNSFDLLQCLQKTTEARISDSELCEILQVQSVKLLKSQTDSDTRIEIKDIEGCLCPRCRRFVVANENDVCLRCLNVLKMQK